MWALKNIHSLKEEEKEMKKAITILAIIAIVACAVFAVDPDPEVRPAGAERITVQTKVDRELPVLKLVGSLAAGFTSATESKTVNQVGYAKENSPVAAVADVSDAEHNGEILDATSIDISHEDLKVYFKVTSAAARCDLIYDIAVTAGKLSSVTDGTTYTIDKAVTFATQTKGDDQENLKITDVGGGATGFEAKATYSGATDAATIGTFDITWAKDNYAPEATYQADVTMTYTVE